MIRKRFTAVLLALVLALGMCLLGGCSGSSDTGSASAGAGTTISESGSYTSKDEVAAYVHAYGKLPSNYITKTKAKQAGWDGDAKKLWDVCPGKSIGGGTFYNDEGLLPEKSGRTYTECDIDFNGKSRGAKRIVFSNDGLIFYTGDHYQSFEQLY